MVSKGQDIIIWHTIEPSIPYMRCRGRFIAQNIQLQQKFIQMIQYHATQQNNPQHNLPASTTWSWAPHQNSSTAVCAYPLWFHLHLFLSCQRFQPKHTWYWVWAAWLLFIMCHFLNHLNHNHKFIMHPVHSSSWSFNSFTSIPKTTEIFICRNPASVTSWILLLPSIGANPKNVVRGWATARCY